MADPFNYGGAIPARRCVGRAHGEGIIPLTELRREIVTDLNPALLARLRQALANASVLSEAPGVGIVAFKGKGKNRDSAIPSLRGDKPLFQTIVESARNVRTNDRLEGLVHWAEAEIARHKGHATLTGLMDENTLIEFILAFGENKTFAETAAWTNVPNKFVIRMRLSNGRDPDTGVICETAKVEFATRQEQRRRALRVRDLNPGWSVRKVADCLGVPETTVRRFLQAMELEIAA